MNSMNDERFFELAMKVIARQATDAERAELDALLTGEPQLKTEFERLRADVRTANEALPLVEATQATGGEFPAYARERLQTKVRQTLGRPAEEEDPGGSLARGWRWALGLAAAAVMVLLVVLPGFRTPNAPAVQLAMLDTAGGTRGADANELALLQAAWKESPVQRFSSAGELEAWEKNQSADGRGHTARIIYDRATGEVRVSGRSKGKLFQKAFPVEKDLATTLRQVNTFVLEQGF